MFRNLSRIFGIVALVWASASAPTARAGEFDDVARISLLPGWVMENGHRMAGLRIQLAPGWKTYWRRPGDAGIPPRFDWTGSQNLAAVEIHWPSPLVFDQNGLRSLGYEHEVVFPLEFIPVDASAALELTGQIEIGVCQQVCIPMQARIDGVYKGKGARDPRITSALASLPIDAEKAGFAGANCEFTPISDGLRVAVTFSLPPGFNTTDAVAIEASDPTIWVSDPDIETDGPIITATSEMVPANARPFLLERSGIRVTLVSAGRAVDYSGCAGPS